ncbi:DinB/UmuC family translesion DNA polymerase [Dialister sp.]|uniref:Y-family DNA polymerase n=1 Tax=Dialister sp. TaxID=1955814 RepID=UPI003EFE08D1
MKEQVYICIDLKSFYASVECAARGLDPFQTDLVVADPTRGPGALCLAVSPALKDKGVKNRCRIFEIPPSLHYIIAPPHMRLYMRVSADIYKTYLRFFAREDVYAYSIDECFINAAPYLSLYGKNGMDIASMIMKAVYERTGICATAGVGTNLFLAKVGMDIVAKHVPEHIAYLDEALFREKLWHHRPITDIWNIGKGIARRLEKYGVYDLYGVTLLPEKTLYREFGVNARYLIDHAHGREPCTLKDIQSYRPENRSISTGQVLFEDYTYEDALLLVYEMAEILIQQLLEEKLAARGISLYAGYSGKDRRGSSGTRKLDGYTDVPEDIWQAFHDLYRKKVLRGMGIRTLRLSLEEVVPASEVPHHFSLFRSPLEEEKQKKVEMVMVEVKKKFGKNALLRGIDYYPKATLRTRNGLIGGHHE